MLQLVGQVPRIVLAQRVNEVQHPALPAAQVLVEPIDGGLAPPRLLPGVKLILKKTHSRSARGSGFQVRQLQGARARRWGRSPRKQGITLSASVRQLRESASDATRMFLNFLRFFKMWSYTLSSAKPIAAQRPPTGRDLR